MFVWRWVEEIGGGILGANANVGVTAAFGVTAMAGLALTATVVISSRRASINSPWSRRKRKRALSRRRWRSLFSSEGKLRDGGLKLLNKARNGGIHPSIRAEVWPFLLGVYDLNSSETERSVMKARRRKVYECLRRRCRGLLSHNYKSIQLLGLGKFGKDKSGCLYEVPESTGSSESSLLDESLYEKNHDEEEENISSITHIETESSDSDSSFEQESEIIEEIVNQDPKYTQIPSLERDPLPIRTTEDFESWKRIIRLDALRASSEWIMYSSSQVFVSEEKAHEFAELVGLNDYDHLEPCMIYHAARLVAVLEAYAIYDPEIGYCQGMSDLLSPILAIIDSDYEAFWCFVGFMKKARHNFRLDEFGIRRQLKIVSKIIQTKDSHLYHHLEKLQAEDCFFVYRMVVVLFRRELSFEQTVRLWEVMWADQAAIRAGVRKSTWGRIRSRAPPTDDLLLYAIAACVLQRKKMIVETSSSMDEIMRECNSLAGQLDVWRLLDDAHELIVALHEKIE